MTSPPTARVARAADQRPVISTAAVAHRETRGRNRRHRGAVVTPGSSSERSVTCVTLARRVTAADCVWSGTVAAAPACVVLRSRPIAPSSGLARSRRTAAAGRQSEAQRGRGRPPSGCRTRTRAGDPAAQPQRPGHQERRSPAPARSAATPRTRRPPPSGRAERVVRRRASAPARPAADHGRRCPPRTEVPADPLRDGQRLLRAPAGAARGQSRSSRTTPRRLPPLRQATWQFARPAGSGGQGSTAARAPTTEWTVRKVGNRLHVHPERSAWRAASLRIARHATRVRARGHQGLRRATPSPTINIDGRAVRRRHAVPGGARVRRRAHPRHGVRVPRRRGALRPPVATVRRAVRAGRLPRPHRHRGLRRGPRDVPLRRGRATTRSAGRRSRTGRHRTR